MRYFVCKETALPYQLLYKTDFISVWAYETLNGYNLSEENPCIWRRCVGSYKTIKENCEDDMTFISEAEAFVMML